MNSNNLDDLFLASGEIQYSYKDLYAFAAYFHDRMQNHERRPEQPIGLCGSSSDEMIFIIASCWLLDIPFIVFNEQLPSQKLTEQINRLKPALIIADSPENIKYQHCLFINEFNPKKILRLGSNIHISWVQKAASVNPSSIFAYFFTSGTSGSPKIVPLKRRQMISAAESSTKNIHPAENECWLLCMPLYHVGGVTVILRSLLYGSAVFHLSNFDAREAAHQLSKNNQVVAASLVPAMLKRLFKIEDFTTHDQFQAILLGGGAVSPDLLEKCFINNIPVITSYGMTETCAQVAANPLFSKPGNENRLQSAGRIFDSNEVEIRGQKNRPVEAGISGSVWLKGPQIFDGYFDETSKKIDAENWFSTADYGKLDENGWLTIEARRTDLIITGGENVSPREVEMALENMEGVKEAAVFGLPDEKWGQRVVAAVVMASPGNIEAEMLKSSLKKELPAFKIPKQFLFVDELPRTPNGKIKRSRLSRI